MTNLEIIVPIVIVLLLMLVFVKVANKLLKLFIVIGAVAFLMIYVIPTYIL